MGRLLARLRNGGFNVETLGKTPFDGYIVSSPTLATGALFSGIAEKQMDATSAYNPYITEGSVLRS